MIVWRPGEHRAIGILPYLRNMLKHIAILIPSYPEEKNSHCGGKSCKHRCIEPPISFLLFLLQISVFPVKDSIREYQSENDKDKKENGIPHCQGKSIGKPSRYDEEETTHPKVKRHMFYCRAEHQGTTEEESW
ncbi:MAG: hypothetical protein HY731_14425 [Candidatus Tectomicrobia bacterium]|nr:hypothetical protein [Candidatus Tectomicrobia bacterium]